MNGHLIDAGGLTWHVVEDGDPAASPVVLVHGLPETWRCWRDQIPPLAERFRVIAPDLKGFGQSGRPEDDYSGPHIAHQLVELLDELRCDSFRLVGHDWGAVVCDFVAAEVPDRVTAYAHLCAPLHEYDPANAPHHELFKDPEVAIPIMRSDGFMRQVFATSCREGAVPLTDDEIDTYTEEWRRPGGAEAVVRYFNEVRLEERRWDRLTMPVQVMTGDSDPRQPLHYVEGLEHVIPGLEEVVIVPDAGHFVTHEQPEFVTEALLAFLTRERGR